MPTSAVLAITPHWHLEHALGAESLRAAADELRQALLDPVLRAGGQWCAGDGETWVALLPAGDVAWQVALGVRRHQPRGHLSIGLGMGEVSTEPLGHAYGDEVSRARRLAWLAPPGSVHCTPAFLRAAVVPGGIGAHQAPEDLAHRLGFGAYQVVDYRQ